MKKLILLGIMAFSVSTFAQTITKNGTIYKDHPYITAVEQSTASFAKGDTVASMKIYADSVKFYDSPSPKPYTLAQARANWQQIFANWDQLTITKVGYPDGLEYSSDPFTVQSWWTITAVNKKTQKKATFQEVVFDSFNKDGKITVELSYYDTSSLMAAMK
jgi:ketosteroid isomerase-like protein